MQVQNVDVAKLPKFTLTPLAAAGSKFLRLHGTENVNGEFCLLVQAVGEVKGPQKWGKAL